MRLRRYNVVRLNDLTKVVYSVLGVTSEQVEKEASVKLKCNPFELLATVDGAEETGLLTRNR